MANATISPGECELGSATREGFREFFAHRKTLHIAARKLVLVRTRIYPSRC